MADLLLFTTLRCEADLLELLPAHGDMHQASLLTGKGAIGCLELASNVADAVIARLALIAALDFTSGTERTGSVRVLCGDKLEELRIAVRPAGGHLAAEIRRVVERPMRTAKPSLEPPERVGDYVLGAPLGQGALGTVYRAQHRMLGRPAAVKIWTLPNVALSRANAAMLREARAASATRHPGVVEVYDFLQLEDGRVAMVMELLDGETLARRIARQGPLAIAEAVGIGRLVAEVLVATEAHGIVHRDLKPENVFLLPDGRVKVLDFGAAARLAGDDRPGTLGTPWYMAPEQAQGGRADPRADVYSFGCVLYEMLTAAPPFDSPDPDAVMRMHREDALSLPVSPHGPIPQPLEHLLLRALAKDAAHRQQSAVELLRELSVLSEALERPGFRKWLPL
jgi:serine/threonine protein kinase